MKILKKIYSKIHFEYKLLKTVGIKIAIVQFIRDFIFRDGVFFSIKLEYYKQSLIKNRVKNDLSEVIDKYKSKNIMFDSIIKNNVDYIPVWVFWAQGFDNAPNIVKFCYTNLKTRIERANLENNNFKLIELSLENYNNYIDLPDYVVEKFKMGKLSYTNYSDIIRVALLHKMGGLWIDSTVLLTEIPKDLFANNVYTVKHRLFKENEHICKGLWTTYFLAGKENAQLYKFCYDMYLLYLEKYDFFISYFLIDVFINIAYEEIIDIRNEIDSVPENNKDVHELFNLLSCNGNKDIQIYEVLKKTNIHKLSYKGKKIECIEKKLKQIFPEISM